MLQLTETTPELLSHFFATYHEYGISAVHHLIAATLMSLASPPDYTLCPQTAITLPQQLQYLFNFLSSPNISHTLSCAQIPATALKNLCKPGHRQDCGLLPASSG